MKQPLGADYQSHEYFLFKLKGRGFNFQDTSYTEFGFNDETLNMVYEMYVAGYDLAIEFFK